MLFDAHKKIKFRPVQLIELSDATVVKRGCTEVRFRGCGVGEVLQQLLSSTSDTSLTVEEVCRFFPSAQHQLIKRLLDELFSRDLIHLDVQESVHESALDVFYWHFNAVASEVTRNLNGKRLVIFGVNWISNQLVMSLSRAGVRNFQVIDHPLLRNLSFFDEAGKINTELWPHTSVAVPETTITIGKSMEADPFDCAIATTDFGRSPLLRQLNNFCIEQKRHFMPVILQNLIGYVGPIVVPGETACFECLYTRENSHIDNYEVQRSIEEHGFQGQQTIGFHPSMASILADLAVIELTKCYSGVLPIKVGTLIELNLLAPRLTTRKVLKLPRCSVCSPLNTRPSLTPMKDMFSVNSHISK